MIYDNIKIASWEAKQYTDSTRKFGYRIVFLTFLPRKLQKYIKLQKITHKKPYFKKIIKNLLIILLNNIKYIIFYLYILFL